MRLRKIKLSGFKSFVDPTTLTVPGQLVGIVGPNGCGKSNIIDAVTWVMGESSAKHLRGDSLTDVIFNGSTNRQPVSQASVELLFDNSEKKITGEFASYNEISIKRKINREAISTYYLNGTRCRRRDITALFLGTGLGPRSYSIIEQGMISRLIEAKPEELRVFIEEAAGISKYRERRRETENRIRHAKENIARLNDIQEELEKQLSHLHRQAKAAERYKLLKVDERKYESELLALNWKELEEKSNKEQLLTRESETKVEKAIADLRQRESDIEKQRSGLSDANEHFNQRQTSFYQVGGDISKLEQTIKHTQERIEASKNDLQLAETQTVELEQQYRQDQERLKQLSEESVNLQPELLGSRSESDKAYEGLNLAEQAMQSWQTEWDTFNEQSANYIQRLQVNRTRSEYLEGAQEEQTYRFQSLTEEYESIDPSVIKQSLTEKKTAIEQANTEFEHTKTLMDKEQQALSQLTEQHQTMLDEQAKQREEKQRYAARLESLKALQESAYGEDDPTIKTWLQDNQLDTAARLAQQLDIDNEWAAAFEVVLSDHLQAVCVNDLETAANNLSQFNSGSLELMQINSDTFTPQERQWPSLSEKITSPESVKSIVADIFIANNLSAALEIRPLLVAGQSVVSKDGIWLGRNWVRIIRAKGQDASLISREQEIQKLNQQLESLSQGLVSLENDLSNSKRELDIKSNNIDELRNNAQRQQTVVSELKGQLVASESQLDQLSSRSEKINEQLEELEHNRNREKDELQRLGAELVETETLTGAMDQQKSQLMLMRDQYRESLNTARTAWQTTHEQSHGIALQLEAITSQNASLEQAVKRNEMQLEHVRHRRQELSKLIGESTEPLVTMQTELDGKLSDKVNAEKTLTEARVAVQTIESEIRKLEEQRTQNEQVVLSRREELEKVRMTAQETRIRREAIEEQFESADQELKTVLEELPEQAVQKEWQEQLESITRKIQRLGAINLAAIDEHSQLSERKNYLDSQQADINEALETLETAIRKIDQETKSRFKETFDNLNTNLKETFPQIFGGGSAYLELTSQDLLETGITVMARPPGKRNTTIHLLSGGEKALTAVALVFSIFKLNPAPFCILDEVDAPLDDANTERFSELVKSMSDEVQFIVITHNKITMEIAQQLLGVTMHEPGVSRLVSVDVDAAVEMAASA